MYVVDTNVISELVKPHPNEDVLAWLRDNERDLFLTVITIEEMRFGALCLPEGKRKHALWQSIDELVSTYAHRVLPFDAPAAERCAEFHHSAISQGYIPTIEDLMIAALCACSGATLVTRNIRDFAYLDVDLFNPFGDNQNPTFD